MRKVIVYALERPKNSSSYVKKEDGKGIALFHQFGVSYEEFETGAGNYSTAIIERTDGQVETVEADLIKFIDA